VIWGGANDIAKHESGKGLTHLLNFVKSCTNTNVIIVGAPKRHDLSKTSCVNEEVDKFNRQLRKTIRVFEYVKVIDSIVSKECYTKRGLHFNSGGKEQMALRIIDQFKSLEVINTPPPIHLPWKEVPSGITPASSDSQSTITATRTSGRTRRQPTTRGDDFYGQSAYP
jgi:hypothetical protein